MTQHTQHSFVVMYDTETKVWVWDWDTEDANFRDGTIWLPELEKWVSVNDDETRIRLPEAIAVHEEALLALRTMIQDPTLSLPDLSTFEVKFEEVIVHTVTVKAPDEETAERWAYGVVLGDEDKFSSNSLGKDPTASDITKIGD